MAQLKLCFQALVCLLTTCSHRCKLPPGGPSRDSSTVDFAQGAAIFYAGRIELTGQSVRMARIARIHSPTFPETQSVKG